MYSIDVFVSYLISEGGINSTNIYDINKNISNSNDSENSINDQNMVIKKISVSPNNRINLSDDNKVIAKLIGDFLPSTSINDFSNYFLLIPSYPQNHPMVIQGPLNWMIVPRENFSLDGRQCNKIGVSYSAFRSQENQCKMRIGDCLNNQIYHLFQNDIDKMSKGKSASYLVSQSKFLNDAKVNYFSYSDQNKKLSFELNGIFNSLISLEISADDLKYVINISSGLIDFLKVNNFESNSYDGLMIFQVTNTGKISSQYNIAYLCSINIISLNADQISLKSFESREIKKNLFTANKGVFTNHNCTVILNDPNGQILDEKNIFFNTTKIMEVNVQLPNNSFVSNNSSTDDQIVVNKEFQIFTCSELCPSFFNFLCFVVEGCWGFFVRTLAIILLLFIFIIFLIRCIKNGTLLKFCTNLCSFFFSSRNESKNEEYNYDIKDNRYKNNDFEFKNYPIKNIGIINNNSLIYNRKMYLNFSNDNFDFSFANIFSNFSIEIMLLYKIYEDFDNKNIDVENVIFSNNFRTFAEKKGIIDLLEIKFLKNKINILPNFLTKYPIFPSIVI